MKKKIVLAAILVLSLVPLSLGAQTAESTEFRFLSFDIGYAPGWDLDPPAGSNNFITPAIFGLNVRIANNLAVGFQYLNDGGVIDNIFLLKYSVLPQLRAVVGFGIEDIATPGKPLTSLGLEVVPFSRLVGGVAATEFKVAVRYDSPVDDMVNGKILFALAFGIGF
jgi:hypothetical protein